GVVLIGPIPIVFGDARMAVIALILTIMLILLSFSLILGWFR
ncbi:MAG: TIGR00304 family protein, partial [Archaeoglobi archaeon]